LGRSVRVAHLRPRFNWVTQYVGLMLTEERGSAVSVDPT